MPIEKYFLNRADQKPITDTKPAAMTYNYYQVLVDGQGSEFSQRHGLRYLK